MDLWRFIIQEMNEKVRPWISAAKDTYKTRKRLTILGRRQILSWLSVCKIRNILGSLSLFLASGESKRRHFLGRGREGLEFAFSARSVWTCLVHKSVK